MKFLKKGKTKETDQWLPRAGLGVGANDKLRESSTEDPESILYLAVVNL